MKKVLTIMAVMAFVLAVFIVPASAQCCGGEAGLEITGGSAVGAVGYMGYAVTNSHTNSCFTGSRTLSVQGFIGASVSSAANGSTCIKTRGNASGVVSGNGHFNSKVSGNIMGQSYSTSSTVNVYGVAH